MSEPGVELRKFLVPEIVYGVGALVMTGQYARNLGGQKALLVTDKGVRAAGWVDAVIESLVEYGLEYAIFDAVTPNPRDHEVMAGVEVYKDTGCDMIVAVGGGSPMDCAKGIGVVSSNGGHVLDYEGVDEVAIPAPPLICVPTTAGTSADVSQFAIISDTIRKVKIAIISKIVVPDVALIDPQTTTTLTAELTAATGMDALVHAVEAYASNASSHLTDLHALEAIRLVWANLKKAIDSPLSIEAREAMMRGSMHAGLAFSNASLGLVHSMAHSLGGFLDLAHGDCNALLLEKVVNLNFDYAAERYSIIARLMGVDVNDAVSVRERLVAALRKFRLDMGIQFRLADLGVTPESIPQLARFALKDPCVATNPFMPSHEAVERLYHDAL